MLENLESILNDMMTEPDEKDPVVRIRFFIEKLLANWYEAYDLPKEDLEPSVEQVMESVPALLAENHLEEIDFTGFKPNRAARQILTSPEIELSFGFHEGGPITSDRLVLTAQDALLRIIMGAILMRELFRPQPE